MRALLIGIGKAGCRIVNMLAAHDQESIVKSVRSYIFDSDRDFLATMEAVDQDKRIQLEPNTLDLESCKKGTDFDLSNIARYFSDTIVDDADAIFVCVGLGGKMGEAVPVILPQLNRVFADPVFTIVTIPARNEGARVSARAAAELEAIREVSSATIIFDNETWLFRLEEGWAAKLAEQKEVEGKDGIIVRESSKLAISDVQDDLNELLTRRVELLLHAGEITPKGIEVAEVVLDAGEILNTLKETDIVSIGYAAEKIPKKLLGFLNRFRMEKYLLEEGHKRTARIIDLAKRAVYEEISVPCDLTTAERVLVLITGPSNELSMKGFQTIRKWIDKSIKGLEMRAADYPVTSTRDVGVIIVLAGIENVPRIAELNEIRTSYEQEIQKKYLSVNDLFNEMRVPELRPATDTEIFEEGQVFSVHAGAADSAVLQAPLGFKDLSPALSVATAATATAVYTAQQDPQPAAEADDSEFFDEEMVVSVGSGTEEEYTEDDEFFTEEEEMQQEEEEEETDEELFGGDEPAEDANPAEDEDFFEERPVRITRSVESVEPATPAAGVVMMTKPEKITAKAKTDPQIVLAGKKKKKQEFDSDIPLPKWNTQPDMVLVGQADLGKRRVLHEGMDRSAIGHGQRPKETDWNLFVRTGQKPKDNVGNVSVGVKQRPKDNVGNVSVGAKQTPKDIVDTARVIAKKPVPTNLWKTVRASQKKRENNNEKAAGSTRGMKWM